MHARTHVCARAGRWWFACLLKDDRPPPCLPGPRAATTTTCLRPRRRWMQLQSVCRQCPVCKAGVDTDKVVPIYGRSNESPDPRVDGEKLEPLPARPVGQRAAATVVSQLGGMWGPRIRSSRLGRLGGHLKKHAWGRLVGVGG